MKIAELKRREAYDDNLVNTLQHCLEIGKSIGWESGISARIHKRQWYLHPFFNVYVTQEFGRTGRDFLYRQYAHAPRRIRRFIQAMFVSLLSQATCFRASLKPAFELDGCPDDRQSMWMPGNHRFRYFDFAQKTITVFPKSGFSTQGIQNEIDFRLEYADKFDWIVPLSHTDKQNAAFEEPLLDMYPLNREPNPTRVKYALTAAQHALQSLHQIQARTIHPESYLDMKRKQYETARDCLKNKFSGLDFCHVEQLWSRASKVIREAKNIEISLTHGDFQPGNILVGYRPDLNPDIAIIDWEDIGIRASIYDEMTYTINARAPQGLYKRLVQFRETNQDIAFPLSCSRALAAALWSIEEWIWLLESSARPGIIRLPAGLCQHFREIAQLR